MKRQALGFGAEKEDGSYETLKGKVLGEAKKALKPEFINRFDDMIVFHALVKADLHKIVDLEVAKLHDRLKNKEIKLVLDEASRDYIIEKGFDPAYGARPMRRAVEKYLEDPLAEELLKGTVKAGDTAYVTSSPEGLVFKTTTGAEEPAAAVVG